MENKFNVIDLFSGCGGLSYGFGMANYSVLLGIDIELYSNSKCPRPSKSFYLLQLKTPNN